MQTENPIFTLIDLDTWSRKEYFDYFYRQVKCTYSVTAEIDISALLTLCKAKSFKLYPAMMHMITTVINQMDEMRITHNEKGQLGIWNYLSPCYTVFHDDDKTFTNIWTEYNQHFTEFNNCFLHDSEQYGKIKKFIAKDHEPGNTFPVSCIPWLDFTAFNLNIYDDANYLSPIFTIGKYKKRDNTIVIPVAVQVHHAVCDGYHASVLFEKIKSLAAQPELWMR